MEAEQCPETLVHGITTQTQHSSGIFVQFDDSFILILFTHTLYVSGIYYPSSGATLQTGAVGITTYGLVLRPVSCHIRLVLFVALCKW
jgi:hypothetical protein